MHKKFLSENLKEIYHKNEIFVKKTVVTLWDAVMSLLGEEGSGKFRD
jgi:hypothetical protein